VQLAKERAREFMHRQLSFAWNATNVTKLLRAPLIDFFVAYGGRVRIVYLKASFDVIVSRNRERRESVPEQVLDRLLDKLEVPDLTEAHTVEWITS